MIRQFLLASLLAVSGLLASANHNDAFACSKTAGCVMDVFRDDYNMKRDGRMEEAIKAGRSNVEAFRALEAKQKANSAGR